MSRCFLGRKGYRLDCPRPLLMRHRQSLRNLFPNPFLPQASHGYLCQWILVFDNLGRKQLLNSNPCSVLSRNHGQTIMTERFLKSFGHFYFPTRGLRLRTSEGCLESVCACQQLLRLGCREFLATLRIEVMDKVVDTGAGPARVVR
jgi:hypothetical protein